MMIKSQFKWFDYKDKIFVYFIVRRVDMKIVKSLWVKEDIERL